jgi:hypothetical protein
VLDASLICKVAREFCNFPSRNLKKVLFGFISLPGRRNSIPTPVNKIHLPTFTDAVNEIIYQTPNTQSERSKQKQICV